MAAQKLFVEVQDEQGNIYYVHTSSDVVFCADGETVEEKLKNATTEKDGRMSAEDKKKLDGIAEGANKYVHPTGSGNKHIPSGGSAGQVLRWSADGTAVWGADKDTTYTAFKAATSSAAGGAGLVPAPAAGNHDDYLRGDGKWGAASDMVQTFSQASSRTNITSGEANKTIFGKVMKWFADLGVSGIAAFAKVVNNGTTTVANTVLDGRFGKTLLDRIVAAEKNITTINSALVEDEKYLNNHASNNKITNLLSINPNGNYGSDYMKPGCIGTEDASQIANCPISQGAFYAWREVLFIPNDNSRYGGKHIVRLTEAYPLSGRIWIRSYNTDTSTWDNRWQCHDPQKQTIAASGNIKFTSAGGKSYGYINVPEGCVLLAAYMQEVPGNVGLRLGGFNQSSSTGYTAWVDWDINDSIFLHWIYAKVS